MQHGRLADLLDQAKSGCALEDNRRSPANSTRARVSFLVEGADGICLRRFLPVFRLGDLNHQAG